MEFTNERRLFVGVRNCKCGSWHRLNPGNEGSKVGTEPFGTLMIAGHYFAVNPRDRTKRIGDSHSELDPRARRMYRDLWETIALLKYGHDDLMMMGRGNSIYFAR